MASLRTVRLTTTGLRRVDEARRRLGISLDELALDRETPSANTVRKALRGEPVFASTIVRIGEFLARRASESHQGFERLREGDDYDYDDAPATAAPARGWVSRHVPPPNRLFTGRADTLERLHRALSAPVVGLPDPQALTGMGGMGKTQTAIAYVFAHRGAYDRIFWANAESRETLDDALSAIAQELGIADGLGSRAAANRARDWFRDETGWLLVLDNADELEAVGPHFPPRHGGRLLLTTRVAVTVRWAADTPLAPLSPDDGATLLLRRAGRLAVGQSLADVADSERAAARALAQELGGLPLALGQDGAFLAGASRTVDDLQASLRLQGIDALTAADPEHAPVSVTLQLALERLAGAGDDGAAATELLRLCAHLDGEFIPDAVLAPAGERAVAAVCALSLAARLAGGLAVHRLVQDSLRRKMTEDGRRRAVDAISAATPDFERPDWQTVAPLLPQWRLCATHIESLGLESGAAVHVLHQAGRFLRIRALYAEAEALQRRAVALAEAVFGDADTRLSDVVDELACLYRETDRLDEAAPLHARAVAIARAAVGEDHPIVASRLHNQALCDTERGDFDRAVDGFRQVLAIRERRPDDFAYTAAALTQLGGALRLRGDVDDAEAAYRRALAVYGAHLDPDHADIGIGLHNLAMLLVGIGRADEAAELFLRALVITERARGSNHPETGSVVWGLARARRLQGRRDEARALYDRAQAIYRQTLPARHVRIQRLRDDREGFDREGAGAAAANPSA